MGRRSVEGYEGGNWPSTTGNPSGGGRGNAEWSEATDDDDRDPGANPGYLRGLGGGPSVAEIFSQAAYESSRSMPSVPVWAVKYEGVITCFQRRGNQVGFWVNTEPREFPFQLAEELVGYWKGQCSQYFYTHNLIGDRVRFVGNKKPRFDNPWTRVQRFENLDWSEERFDHDPDIFEQENKLRSGNLGNRSLIQDPVSEHNSKRWFLMSGNYFCRSVGFATQEHAAAWMDSLQNYIQWREGYKFKINKNWFECSIVDADGNSPQSWSV